MLYVHCTEVRVNLPGLGSFERLYDQTCGHDKMLTFIGSRDCCVILAFYSIYKSGSGLGKAACKSTRLTTNMLLSAVEVGTAKILNSADPLVFTNARQCGRREMPSGARGALSHLTVHAPRGAKLHDIVLRIQESMTTHRHI